MDTGQTPSSATRDRILAAARLLFLRDGYAAVGINAICAAAGVVKGSFYHFFPGKADLLDAVIARNRAELLAALETASGKAPDGRSGVQAQFEVLLEVLRSQKTETGQIQGCPIGMLVGAVPPVEDAAVRAGRGALEAWRERLATQVRRGIADGSVARSVEPDAAALSLLAVLQGMGILGRSFDDADPLTSIAVNAMKRLLPVGSTASSEI